MDFWEVIGKQRMTRRFSQAPVPPELLETVLHSARKAPSAGFSQGVVLLVLEGEQQDLFWRITHPEPRQRRDLRPPIVILPLASKQAYLDRYSEPDKIGTGRHSEAGWPVPYWLVDCAFATMTILLGATAEGLGCWFFGIYAGEAELLERLGIPDEYRPIGAIGLGFPAERDVRSPSLKRGSKPTDEFIRHGRW